MHILSNKNTGPLHRRIRNLQQEPNYFNVNMVGIAINEIKQTFNAMSHDIDFLNLLDDLIIHCSNNINDVTDVVHYLMGKRDDLPSPDITEELPHVLKEEYKIVCADLLRVNSWGCLGKSESKAKTLDKLVAFRKSLFNDVDSAKLQTRDQSFNF